MHTVDLTETETIIFNDTMQVLGFRLYIHRTNIKNSSYKLHNSWLYLKSQSCHNRHKPE